MRVIDFSETLRESINDKINQCRNGIHESHIHIDKDRLMIEIRALEWARVQISDLENKERKEKIDRTEK
jgi:hypothetical protein